MKKAETTRKPGRRKKNYDDESTVVLLQRTKAQLHWDFGGCDPVARIREQARKAGIDMGPRSAAIVLELIKEMLADIREQVNPLLDRMIEAERRNQCSEKCP